MIKGTAFAQSHTVGRSPYLHVGAGQVGILVLVLVPLHFHLGLVPLRLHLVLVPLSKFCLCNR